MTEKAPYTTEEVAAGKHFYVRPGSLTEHEKRRARRGDPAACVRCGGPWDDKDRHLEPAIGFTGGGRPVA